MRIARKLLSLALTLGLLTQTATAYAGECDSMELLQAKFLLDEPDRQPELSASQLELLGRCRIELHGINLSGRHLPGVQLSGADLTDAEMPRTNLSGGKRAANLSGAKLNGANLEGANFHGVNLRGADLRHTFLAGADLKGAILDGANLSWPHALGQKENQGLVAAQLDNACWNPAHPPQLPRSLQDYKRPSEASAACGPAS